jgi:hypothetical protein
LCLNSYIIKKHKWRWSIVENAFDILNKTFWEILYQIDLDLILVPNVFMCCCFLHNLIHGQRLAFKHSYILKNQKQHKIMKGWIHIHHILTFRWMWE